MTRAWAVMGLDGGAEVHSARHEHDEHAMTKPHKPNPAASALARKRWAGTTKEQRREATRAATAASPRTKKRKPAETGSPES